MILNYSERLTDYLGEWYEIPVNHLLLVDNELVTTTIPFITS
jgi:hypothetical protein